MNQISFLKRKFVKHETGKYVAPLDMNSIYKALEWRIPSSAVTSKDQMLSTAASVLWEIFFHCTSEDQFHSFKNDLIELISDKYFLDVSYVEFSLPDYGVIYN